MSQHSGADDGALFASELKGGEKILWTGRPDPAVHFAKADIYQVPVSLGVLVVSLIIFSMMVANSPPGQNNFFTFLALTWVSLLVAYMLFGRFIVKARSKMRTTYALTNKRALLAKEGKPLREASLDSETPRPSISRSGHLTVIFAPPRALGGLFTWNEALYRNTGLDFLYPGTDLAFVDVADADGLLDALDEAGMIADRESS